MPKGTRKWQRTGDSSVPLVWLGSEYV